ncbi:MAG: hypothetical protein ABRQ31_09355, partial [Smithellaceae bacterium]
PVSSCERAPCFKSLADEELPLSTRPFRPAKGLCTKDDATILFAACFFIAVAINQLIGCAFSLEDVAPIGD